MHDVYNDVLYYPGFHIGSDHTGANTGAQDSSSTIFLQLLQVANLENKNVQSSQGNTGEENTSPFRSSSPFFRGPKIPEGCFISPRNIVLSNVADPTWTAMYTAEESHDDCEGEDDPATL
jgi:hypothetical protein